jgi:hypothetical protein
MKRGILLLVTLISLSCIYKTKENTSYTNVIDYLKRIEPYKSNGVHVVDTLFYISTLTLREDLIRKIKDSNKSLQIIDSLEKQDTKRYFTKEQDKSLIGLSFNLTPKYNLYFSKPKGNIINFEVLDNKGDANNSHDYLTTFGIGHIYSVLINKDGSVKKIREVEIIYN